MNLWVNPESWDHRDAGLWTVYWSGILVCFMTSTFYHLAFNYADPTLVEKALTIDLAGILSLFITSFISTVLCMFPDHPSIRNIYISVFALVVLVVLGYFVFVDRTKWRNTIFQVLGLVFLGMAIHDVVLRSSPEGRWVVGRAILTTTPTYATGFAFYLSGFPESRWPGKFRVLGNSHNIWHVFVVMGTAVHAFNVHALLRVRATLHS